jgi:hypothetical protein
MTSPFRNPLCFWMVRYGTLNPQTSVLSKEPLTGACSLAGYLAIRRAILQAG